MKKLTLLGAAVAVLVATGGYAYACGEKENKSSTSAAVASSDAKSQTVPAVASGGSCAAKKATTVSSGACAAKGSNAKSATVLTGAGGSCGSKTSSASLAGADHCTGKATKAVNAKMAEECAKGECADLVFTIADMDGDCCSGKVESALASVKGVHGVWVDAETKKAYVCASTAKKIDTKAALKNLKKAGFSNAKYVGVETAEVKKAG